MVHSSVSGKRLTSGWSQVARAGGRTRGVGGEGLGRTECHTGCEAKEEEEAGTERPRPRWQPFDPFDRGVRWEGG